MIEFIESIDRAIVLAINSCNSPFFDELMWWISARITWIPLYFLLIFLAYRKIGLKSAFLFLVFVILTIIVADTISVYGIKEIVQRYRPSHNTMIKDSLHYYKISNNNYYTGGDYGFVSSHASNFFALATCFYFVFKKEYKKLSIILFAIAILVSYSRIYLGVHYLSDIIGGAILGFMTSFFTYNIIWKKVFLHKK